MLVCANTNPSPSHYRSDSRNLQMALRVPLKSLQYIILGLKKKNHVRVWDMSMFKCSWCHWLFGSADRTKSNHFHTVQDITRGV